jgi:predicted aldo/keto reductase-like oxidoreductase
VEKRRLGRTGHISTVAILGGFVLSQATPNETDRIMEMVLEYGVNHIDIAPSYGHAEAQLGPWMKRTKARDHFFLGCKTMERTRAAALDEMRRSLERLNTDHFDLYQIHAITSMEELNEATKTGGALDALITAREIGLTRFLGITGHGFESPNIFLEAISRYDFDTILFPLNFVQYSNPNFREDCNKLITECRNRDIGTMIIKSITKRPWGDRQKTHITWYEPFSSMENIQQAVDFALSHGVTGICTAGDPKVLPKVLQACEEFTPMTIDEQNSLIQAATKYEPLFT